METRIHDYDGEGEEKGQYLGYLAHYTTDDTGHMKGEGREMPESNVPLHIVGH